MRRGSRRIAADWGNLCSLAQLPSRRDQTADSRPVASASSTVRKSIARVLTIVNQKTRQNLRELYKGKKHLPLDLRTKKTRAIRRRLTKDERMSTTERATKKAIHFPKRRCASLVASERQSWGCS